MGDESTTSGAPTGDEAHILTRRVSVHSDWSMWMVAAYHAAAADLGRLRASLERAAEEIAHRAALADADGGPEASALYAAAGLVRTALDDAAGD